MNRLLKINRLFECRLKTETRNSHPFLFRIVYLVFLILVIIHWNGCIYFLISKQIGIGYDNWVYNNTETSVNDLGFEYVSCFYWSILMLTTIGEVSEPENNSESFVMIINFLIAIVLVATLVGNIGSVISNMSIEQDNFKRKVDAIKNLMNLRKVSSELDRRVIKWFAYFHENCNESGDSDPLDNLPIKLGIEIASYVHLETLKNVNIFAECEIGLLKELVTKLKVQIYSPDDYVCRKGDIGKEMYIIKKGCLNVVSDDAKIIFVTLKAGAFFGEISILNIPGIKTGNRRTANVRSVGYSELLRLTKNDLWEALVDYPENKNFLLEKGKAKLKKDNLLEEEEIGEDGEVIKKGIEFDSKADLEEKFQKLEALGETLEKRNEEILTALNESCEAIKKKIENVKFLYSQKVGITV